MELIRDFSSFGAFLAACAAVGGIVGAIVDVVATAVRGTPKD